MHATAPHRRLFQVWYYNGDGENTCELVMLHESQVPYVERMFEHMYGDMGEVVESPVEHVESLAELVKTYSHDAEEWK